MIQLAEYIEVAHRDSGIDAAVAGGGAWLGDPVRPELSSRPADAEKIFHGLDEVGSWEPVFDAEPGLRDLLEPSSTRR